MDMNGIYQKDNKFEGEESLYYVLAGNGGSSRLSKNEKYHIITCSAVAIYDINVICGKTGYTEAAGYCLVILSESQTTGHRFISVILNAPSRDSLYNQMSYLLEKAANQ